MKTQYQKLGEDWRHFNSIIWGIPSVAVAIMTGIIITAYQPQLVGWPRFTSLAVGSLFLFALAVELSRKIQHMYAISFLLDHLQKSKTGLNLPRDLIFPVGISDDVQEYTNIKFSQLKLEQAKKLKPKPIDYYDGLFQLLTRFHARKYLVYVIFVAFIGVVSLAVIDLIGIIIRWSHYSLPFELP